MPSRAAQRLMHDHKEVMAAREIVGVLDASPLENNLFEWHVNLWKPGRDGSADYPIHLILNFTEEYPSKPPSILLCTPFPHSNVVLMSDGSYSICLDMLEARKNTHSPYSGWTSAMSVLSILVQLQSFLTYEKLHYTGNTGMGFERSMDRALETMANFECKKCTHHGVKAAWPARRQQADCPSPPMRLVCRPCGTIALAKPAPEAAAPPPKQLLAAAPPPKPSLALAPPKPQALKGKFAVLSVEGDEQSDADDEEESAAVDDEGTSEKTGPSKRTQKKNAYRARKRERERGGLGVADAAQTAAASAAVVTVATAKPTASIAEQRGCDDPNLVCADPEAHEETAAECSGSFALLSYDALIIVMEKLHSEADVRSLACTCSHLRSACSDGLLWRVLFHRHFPASQLAAASLSDWRHAYMLEHSSNAELLRCYHSKATLGALDEKRGGLEVLGIPRTSYMDLRLACKCSPRRHRSSPQVFGIPLTFTVNPRTHEVDCIYSTLDTLSYSAFRVDGVRTSVWGEAFTHFLPLYLTRDHFKAARPILHQTIAALCANAPRWRFAQGRFVPEMALDVLPKLLCTLVVLLVDRGVAASDVFINGFTQVYRLLLALAHEHPMLRAQVTKRVQEFIGKESKRGKASEPSLGDLVPLLAICNSLRWSDLAWPLLEEMMDRSVLWACRHHPELATPHTLGVDELVQRCWEARRVSNRLLMFSVGFLSRLSKVSPAQLDDFNGNPTPWLRHSMRQHIAKVMAADSWPEFYALINVPLPSKAYIHAWFIRAVGRSEQKGYHKKGMDFSRVQRSGVSAIMRKGESVTASPTMKAVRFEEVWRWAGEDTLYLDASALAYSFDGKPLAYVDYDNQRSATGLVSGGVHTAYGEGGRGVALRHSGDQIDAEKREGTHRVDIDLRALSDQVGAIYLTLSAWDTARLSDIIRPEVRCFDPADRSGVPLARYELDGRPTGEQTAVVMAKIWRTAPGHTWKVTAIGELGLGRAGNYTPIHNIIAQTMR